MILPDVNTLVYTFHRDATEHDFYAPWLDSILRGTEPLALADVVLTGFTRTRSQIIVHSCSNVVESRNPRQQTLR